MTETIYLLRTADADHRSYGGFQWPSEPGSVVEAPDWDPEPKCMHGLHGYPRGEGEGRELRADDPDAIWQVIEAEAEAVVRIPNGDGKAKVPRCTLVYAGDRETAIALIHERHPDAAVWGSRVITGDRGVSISGGYGTSISGEFGIAVSGIGGKSISGYSATSISGNYGMSISGYGGGSTSGIGGISTSGDLGMSISGYLGKSASGHHGMSTSGEFGIAASGIGGRIQIVSWDGRRYRLCVGYVGEDGIEPDTYYLCRSGRLVRVDPQPEHPTKESTP